MKKIGDTLHWSTIPAALFAVDASLRLLEASDAAIQLFAPVMNASFLELLDPGSIVKARRLLVPGSGEPHQAIELNMITAQGRTMLVDVYPRWHSDGLGWLYCGVKNTELERIELRIGRMTNLLKEEALPAQTVRPLHGSRPPRDEAAQLRSRIEVALELLEMLRPDLIELGKDDFLNVILAQLRAEPHRDRES
ncbi:nitrogen regulation protein NR(II) [Paenibacillus xanthanilyticus]|uniref:PAS fold-4 domain-containing protein n=1 Tax=Paenibacillus xanthanilyticus TaxID=1783531 RepID=A0ABV8KAX1_9BACL